MEAGDWGMGNGESGSGESGLGTRDWRVGSRWRTADAGTSCPLSAYRFPNLLIVFFNDLNNQLGTRESGIGKLTADSW